MRIAFFGSGAFGLPTLDRLADEHALVALVTQPDRPAGRKRRLTPTPVGRWAADRGFDAWKSDDVNDPSFVARVADARPDASVVIAFGQKLSPELIAAMGDLTVNLHASLLPKYRGAAPIQRAMIAGERVTGVSVIALAQKMDAGDVYATRELAIDPAETAGELHDRLAGLGPDAIGQVLADLAAGTLRPVEQDHDAATKAHKLTKAEGTVGFDRPADAIRARVHGLTPWPGCRVAVRLAGRRAAEPEPLTLCRVKVAQADRGSAEPGTLLGSGVVATGSPTQGIALLEVQAPGGRPMAWGDFARGRGEGWAWGAVLTAWRAESG